MRGRAYMGAVLVVAGTTSALVAQTQAPDPALIRTSPTTYFTQLGEVVRSQLPASATPKERADRVFSMMDALAQKHHQYPVNKSLLGRVQGLPASTTVGTCGWWTTRMREAFTAAGIPKGSIVVLESHVKDPTVSGGVVSDTIVDAAHDLANVNNVHQAIAVLDGKEVRTYDVWQDGADLDTRSSSTVFVGAISSGPEKGRLVSGWFARQAKDGRPYLTQDGVHLPRSLLVLRNRNAALEIIRQSGLPALAPGVTPAQLDEWLTSQSLLELTQSSRLDPEGLVERLRKSRLAAIPRPSATGTPASSSGCWEKSSGPSEIPFVDAPGRGYAGSGSASAGSVSLRTHPADPKWSHLVTGGLFTWDFGRSRPARLCPGDVLIGSATFSNNGTQLTRPSYSPSGNLKVELGAGGRGVPLFQLSSADLPAPGQTVTRPFRYPIPSGSLEVNRLRIVAEVYAGRIARFTEVYHWTPR